MNWWRIEVDVKGKVVSCRKVEKASKARSSVFYVQAETREQAGRAAWNAYCRAQQRERRERLRADGLCMWCGRANDRDPEKRCSICLAKSRRHNARRDAKARGEDVAPADRTAALADRRELDRLAIRLEVLREVRGLLDELSLAELRKWLDVQVSPLAEEPVDEAPPERPRQHPASNKPRKTTRLCNKCFGMAHRVKGDVCAECGLERSDAA